ncbi:2Fe-2S iron-sulfur cluster-binding protein [Coralliovum pocilloporae]|uniref:2Fe-2S iron-sulfur cluster-binding protein n=1 Tax=Coralliovum pocilloporae TaxID=3066369 RepID=UPI0033069FE2
MRLFSYRNRPVHLGPFPLERLTRTESAPSLAGMVPDPLLDFDAPGLQGTLAPSIRTFLSMLDVLRDGEVWSSRAEIPDDPCLRSENIKSTGYYFDASMMGIGTLSDDLLLPEPRENPALDDLAAMIEAGQVNTFASGIDVVLADVLSSARAERGSIDHHSHVIACLTEYPRDPGDTEEGTDWIRGLQTHRAALRSAETAVVLSNYIRILGYEARAHTATASDIALNRAAVSAGLACVDKEAGDICNPYLGRRFGLAAVTTTLDLACDQPLAVETAATRRWSHGARWWLGYDSARGGAVNGQPYAKRLYKDGLHPHETLKRRETPTTYIDEERVRRVPKRADMFARALFGDLGKKVQDRAKGGRYVIENPLGYCARRPLGALSLLQDGPVGENADKGRSDANAARIKAALNFLGADAVGLSRCPDWAYYSHDASGKEITPYHSDAVSIIIDQGHETMEGASGDDWISAAQSMRAYLRTSLIGGVVADHIRRLGYPAMNHTVLHGEVLQPPLLLLSGLGEVSRIGEVILNPFLGPRLKSGAITTTMPMAHDKPIDFGMQSFCEACNKCARECPSGSITAGPKRMFNGYEIWKSDAEKCGRYRITNASGSMCGRCMKTCPWNLEGLFAEAPFRWMAMNWPGAAKTLAALDDWLGNGSINPVKKWWWDLELTDDGHYRQAEAVNQRGLNRDLTLRHEDQTLACYPADSVPAPFPAPSPINRQEGIQRYKTLLSPEDYRRRLNEGDTAELAPPFQMPEGEPPAFPVILKERRTLTDKVDTFVFETADGRPLPAFEPGAHIDVVVAPEYFRQFSLAGDPNDLRRYEVGVLREDTGRGGSRLMHQVFRPGRKVFISPPRNHFPLLDDVGKSLLFGGGIGITPFIPMAWALHRAGRPFHLHYAVRDRSEAAYWPLLQTMPWKSHVSLHVSAEGTRLDLTSAIGNWSEGQHAYTCGPVRFMDGVFDAARVNGWSEASLHREYFAVPDAEDYENHPFTLKLAESGRLVPVRADETATDALMEAGVAVDVKCSDGLCGVCTAEVLEGDVEHRDYVLSDDERKTRMVLCCSRGKTPDGTVTVQL